MGLQIADAAALIAPGAADHLVEQLKRPLGGTWITMGEALIGIEHADQAVVFQSDDLWRPVACR